MRFFALLFTAVALTGCHHMAPSEPMDSSTAPPTESEAVAPETETSEVDEILNIDPEIEEFSQNNAPVDIVSMAKGLPAHYWQSADFGRCLVDFFDDCVQSAAYSPELQDKFSCDDLISPERQASCRDNIANEMALEAKDASLCAKIDDQFRQRDCQISVFVSVILENPTEPKMETCAPLSDDEAIQECQFRAAQELLWQTGDENVCQWWPEGEQEFCRLEAKNIQESLAQEAAFLEAENSSAEGFEEPVEIFEDPALQSAENFETDSAVDFAPSPVEEFPVAEEPPAGEPAGEPAAEPVAETAPAEQSSDELLDVLEELNGLDAEFDL